MQRSRSALVVAATPALAAQLSAWLQREGWCVHSAHSYHAARTRLDSDPDLLVTEVELGDYNGLQLALRARVRHIPALAIGPEDSVLQRDAEQFGCSYVTKDELDQHRLSVAVESRLASMIRALPPSARYVEFAKHPQASPRSASGRRLLLH